MFVPYLTKCLRCLVLLLDSFVMHLQRLSCYLLPVVSIYICKSKRHSGCTACILGDTYLLRLLLFLYGKLE